MRRSTGEVWAQIDVPLIDNYDPLRFRAEIYKFYNKDGTSEWLDLHNGDMTIKNGKSLRLERGGGGGTVVGLYNKANATYSPWLGYDEALILSAPSVQIQGNPGYLRLPPGGQIYLERETGGGTVVSIKNVTQPEWSGVGEALKITAPDVVTTGNITAQGNAKISGNLSVGGDLSSWGTYGNVDSYGRRAYSNGNAIVLAPDSLGRVYLYGNTIATSYHFWSPWSGGDYLNVHADDFITHTSTLTKETPENELVKAIDREFSRDDEEGQSIGEISTASGLLWLKMYDRIKQLEQEVIDLKAKVTALEGK